MSRSAGLSKILGSRVRDWGLWGHQSWTEFVEYLFRVCRWAEVQGCIGIETNGAGTGGWTCRQGSRQPVELISSDGCVGLGHRFPKSGLQTTSSVWTLFRWSVEQLGLQKNYETKNMEVEQMCQYQLLNPFKPKRVQIIFKNSVCTSKKTQHFTITQINLLMLFKEIIPVYTENHTRPINTKCTVTDC
jgi:hypothetical protein